MNSNNRKKDNAVRGMFLTLVGGTLWGFSGTCGQFLMQNQGSDLQLAGAYPPASGWCFAFVYLLAQRWKRDFSDLDSGCGFYSDFWNSRYEHVPVYLFYGDWRLQCRDGNGSSVYRAGSDFDLSVFEEQKAASSGGASGDYSGGCRNLSSGYPWPSGKYGSFENSFVLGTVIGSSAAVYTVQPGRLLNEYGSAVVTAWGMLIGGIMLCCIFHPWTIPVETDSQVVLGMAVIILVGTVIAFSCYMEGIRCVGAKKEALCVCGAGFVATVFSVIWMHVSFGLMDLIGFACIISTIFLLALDKKE